VSVLMLVVPVGATVAELHLTRPWEAQPPARGPYTQTSATATPASVIVPMPTTAEPPTSTAVMASATAVSAAEYTVAAGDTLRTIARTVYGDAAEWDRVYSANRAAIGPDPNRLPVGVRLRLPAG
jgi:nucleoid-associated protein YgaU